MQFRGAKQNKKDIKAEIRALTHGTKCVSGNIPKYAFNTDSAGALSQSNNVFFMCNGFTQYKIFNFLVWKR